MKNRTEENGSKNNEWETPEYVFDELNKDSRFNMDLCATDKNKKCLDWTDDALNYIPHKLGLDIWCNPPYSFPLKDKIIRKCYELSQMKGVNSVTMLIPSSTETRVFHDIIWKYALRIEFIDTRVRFKGYNTKGEYVTNATGQSGSMIVTFIKRHELSSDRPYVLTRKFEYREYMMNFKLLRTGDNTIEDHTCKFCNKCAQYYRYKENDYVCKEHLFGKREANDDN